MDCERKDSWGALRRRCGSLIAAVLTFLAIGLWTGCGDIYRPTANPIPGPTTDPRNFHIAVVVSQNAVGNPGSGMQIDVSGDSNVGVVNAGQQPLYAALLPQSTRVFVSNSDGTLSTFTPAGFLGSIGTPSTISLPAGLVPGFLFSTESGTIYAGTSGSYAGCATAPMTGALLAISATSLAVENIMCVGPNPSVLTETPDGRKVYSVNSDGTISSINTIDKSVNPPISCSACTPALTSPVWAVSSLDSAEVFVLDATGYIWIINTFTDQIVSPTPVLVAGASSNFMALDGAHNRLFVTSAATPSTLSILDASTPALKSLRAAPMTLPAGTAPVMAAFLPNGNASYILSDNPTTRVPTLTVVNSATNAVSGTIDLPATTVNPSAVATCQAVRFPFAIAVSGNSGRVYVTNCYAGTTSIIDTTTNTQLLTMSSPTSAYPPVSGTTYPPPQNPVFVVAGP